MHSAVEQIFFWSFTAAAVMFGLLALYLGTGWRGGKLGGLLLGAVGMSALWCAFSALFGRFAPSVLMLLGAAIAGLARQALWSLFLLGLLRVAVPADVRGAAPRVLAGAGLGLFALLVAMTFFGGPLNVSPRGQLLPALLFAIWQLALVEQVYRNFPPTSRWGIKPLVFGLGCAFVFDLYLFADAFLFGRIDADVAAIRGLVHALAVPLIAMSAVRSHDWTFRVTVSREMVFHTTALAACGLYLLLVSGAGYYVRWFGGDWGRSLQMVLLFSALLLLVVMLFSGSVRARLRVWVGKHFFVYRYDYRNAWLKFTRALTSPPAGQTSEQGLIGALANLVESPGGVLWQRDADGMFRPRAFLYQTDQGGEEPGDGPLCVLMRTRGWIINVDEWRARPEAYDGIAVPMWLAAHGDAWLVVPLLCEDELIGFVVLAAARAPVDVNWEVLDLLKTASRQAASYLARATALAALLEAQKFDSFNRMSAFVVHDLKNLVAQLALLLKNADRHKNNPEFQADMLLTVENVAERMRALMQQLQNKSPMEPRRLVDLAEVCTRIVATRGPGIALDCDAELAVLAHAERLERIIGHVVQNAREATPESGHVGVEARREGAQAVVRVTDEGCGMSAEFIRERLFRPFQTTKTNGMGLGAFEVQQYISELGGRVAVDSTPGKGTRVTLYLPLTSRVERFAA
ncbi:MAG: PEP-CTERM system histidine kinase PrsK [Rhodocyclaceae bacterium]